MKIKGQISIFINREFTKIEIHDYNASTILCEITLTPEELSAALSRQSYVNCELYVGNLGNIGKKHESKQFEFEIPPTLHNSKNDENLRSLAQSKLSDGWIADSYFGRQDSFFTKDGKQYARVTIRRYI